MEKGGDVCSFLVIKILLKIKDLGKRIIVFKDNVSNIRISPSWNGFGGCGGISPQLAFLLWLMGHLQVSSRV